MSKNKSGILVLYRLENKLMFYLTIKTRTNKTVVLYIKNCQSFNPSSTVLNPVTDSVIKTIPALILNM